MPQPTTPGPVPSPTPPPTLAEMVERAPSREVLVRPRTLLVVAATGLGVAAAVWVLLEAWQVITWIVIAIFLAIALTPAVDALERRGLSAGVAVPIVIGTRSRTATSTESGSAYGASRKERMAARWGADAG